jgi:hypothetical protein
MLVDEHLVVIDEDRVVEGFPLEPELHVWDAHQRRAIRRCYPVGALGTR